MRPVEDLVNTTERADCWGCDGSHEVYTIEGGRFFDCPETGVFYMPTPAEAGRGLKRWCDNCQAYHPASLNEHDVVDYDALIG